jgi:hypothetical protein
MQQILENELLGFCLAPLGDHALSIVDRLSEEEAETCRLSLAAFLLNEAEQDTAPVEVSAVDVPGGRDFKSILYRDRGADDSTKKIVAFSFRDAAFATALPLLGVTIMVFTGKLALAAAPQIAGILKTLWGKVVVLKPPADKDAIDVLEGLVRVRAAAVAAGSTEYPTNVEIERQSGLLREHAQRGLSRLNSLDVIETVRWGGQAGDLNHPDNQWKVRL